MEENKLQMLRLMLDKATKNRDTLRAEQNDSPSHRKKIASAEQNIRSLTEQITMAQGEVSARLRCLFFFFLFSLFIIFVLLTHAHQSSRASPYSPPNQPSLGMRAVQNLSLVHDTDCRKFCTASHQTELEHCDINCCLPSSSQRSHSLPPFHKLTFNALPNDTTVFCLNTQTN